MTLHQGGFDVNFWSMRGHCEGYCEGVCGANHVSVQTKKMDSQVASQLMMVQQRSC